MVVFKIDIQCFFTRPTESNPVISSHSHRPTLGATLKAMESKAGNVHVLRLRSHIQQLQNADAFPYVIASYAAGLPGQVDFFKPLVSEASNHQLNVKLLVYNCNVRLCQGAVAGRFRGYSVEYLMWF